MQDAAAVRTGKTMAVLKKTELVKARKLWGEVFEEDTAKFLDYYETYVADHNQIFAEEEAGDVVSMVQLNPYRVHIGEAEADSYYIVAVATRESCRHQGRMRRLLAEALQQMYQEKIPFTFLMPASESIYLPFDFVTVYRQSLFTCGVVIPGSNDNCWHCIPCRWEQLKELAEWSNVFLQNHSEISTVRTEDYYKRIWKEQESMNGQILLFYEGSQTKGYCFTGYEGSGEAWEIVVEADNPEEQTGSELRAASDSQALANRRAVEALTRWFGEQDQLPMRICGFLPESYIDRIPLSEMTYRPMTMVRIVNLEAFVSRIRAKKPVQFVLYIKDPIIPENCGTFCFEVGRENATLTRMEENTEQNKGAGEIPELTISELAAALYGVERNEKIPQSDICLLEHVYLNEIV